RLLQLFGKSLVLLGARVGVLRAGGEHLRLEPLRLVVLRTLGRAVFRVALEAHGAPPTGPRVVTSKPNWRCPDAPVAATRSPVFPTRSVVGSSKPIQPAPTLCACVPIR